MTTSLPRVDVLGIGVNAITMATAVDQISRWIESREQHYVCVTGVHGVMESQSDPELLQIHNQSGLTTPDGMPMVWAARWAGVGEVERVYGPDLMLDVCSQAAERGWSCFFYGGRDGVPEILADRLSKRFPGLKVVGTYSPPFRQLSDEEDLLVVERINEVDPDLVWVGLSTPKQERWMASHMGKLQARVLLGVGAAFDIHAGLVLQAPRWVQRSGLEWLYRIYREPRRLWRRYLKNNPRFLVRVATSPPRLRVPADDLSQASRPGRSRSRSGVFLVLVGPDGVGKTSVARALAERFDGPTAYFHFRPTPFGDLPPAPPAEMAPAQGKYPPAGPIVLGWLRLARHVFVCWLGHLLKIRPALKRGALVVGDRWSYGYLVQPQALRFSGPEWMAALCIRLLPRPHGVVNLTASVEEIRGRKQELSELKIREELAAWSALRIPNLMTVQTEGKDPAEVARRILESF